VTLLFSNDLFFRLRFRALKTKGNTPKYGLIYHSTFIGRAEAKNKGRISRYLANKCSMAVRIDSFSDTPTSAYGVQLRNQVEERLQFYETGAAPKRNIDVMEAVARELKKARGDDMDVDDEDDDNEDGKEAEKTSSSKKSKKKKSKGTSPASATKRKAEEATGDEDDDEEDDKAAKQSAKKEKKDKKEKKKIKKSKKSIE
jgi:nucleolar protein 56